jgi:hypothetical protein
LTEGTHRTETSASSELSGVYIGPLIRHCLRGKRGPRVQALRVPYSHGYSRVPPPFKDSPITSGPPLYFRGDYCAPGCRLLSSSVQPYPLQVRNCPLQVVWWLRVRLTSLLEKRARITLSSSKSFPLKQLLDIVHLSHQTVSRWLLR